MPERDKVIKGLNYCTHTDGAECLNCSYWQDDDCVETLNADALALLKEQEVVEPQLSISGMWYECPICYRHLLKDMDNYCARCGRRLKWG